MQAKFDQVPAAEWRWKLAATEKSCEFVMSLRRGTRLKTSWKMRKTTGCEMENDYVSLLRVLLSV